MNNLTAEEFVRNKIKELHPKKEVVTLSREIVSAETAMKWAHEYNMLNIKKCLPEKEIFEALDQASLWERNLTEEQRNEMSYDTARKVSVKEIFTRLISAESK